MKTDWHRYNLKRRVVDLPSISSDVFAEKVLQLRSQEDEQEDEFGFYVNKRERRRRNLEREHENQSKEVPNGTRINTPPAQSSVHESDRRQSTTSMTSEFSEFSLGESCDYHSEIETGSELNYTGSEFSEIEYVTTDDESLHEKTTENDNDVVEEDSIIPITTCFYCGKNNIEIEANIKHMFSKHGLYLPERSFLHDVLGLLTYISEIISDYECLVCQFQGKNLTSIRQHTTSKGHCRLPYETKEDKLLISQFYTFYDDSDEDDTKERSQRKVAFEGEENNENENENENESEDEEWESEEDNGINDNYTLVHVNRTGSEMTLPTGSVIGHRSQMKYYRQSLPLARESKDGEKTVALIDRRYAPGLTVHSLTKQEKQTRRIEQNARNVAVRKDKTRKVNYQPHFRDEILGT
jgi:pre-60S factor REI1